jgi:hypothetical protein
VSFSFSVSVLLREHTEVDRDIGTLVISPELTAVQGHGRGEKQRERGRELVREN